MSLTKLPSTHRDPTKLIYAYQHKPATYWMKAGKRRAFRLFHKMAERVPAYKKFLKKENINPRSIKTYADFQKNVPLLDKENYLKKYSLEELCWDGKFQEKHWDISSTSGSTGIPFYFPRSDDQNEQYALTAELYLRNNFKIHKKTTLYINCFALGIWIGGIFTYEAIKRVAEGHRYPLTLINPGLNKIEIIKTVKNLGSLFDQVILGGYPPFIKDVIDDGIAYGLKWRKYNLGIIFSAEGFSETFRSYVHKKAGIENIYTGSLNHYGTVDQGTLAHETPLTTLLRRLTIAKPKITSTVFRNDITRLPTLCQYDPTMFFFEEIKKGVVCSSYSGLPLVRYDLKDFGGIHLYEDITNGLQDYNINLYKEARKAGIDKTIWRLPFVYVYERKDFSVVVSGANVYPETIKKSLQKKNVNKYFTGKFTMITKSHKSQDQYLEINIELKNNIKNVPQKMQKYVENLIITDLLRENSEYRVIYEQKCKDCIPNLIFWPYEDKTYFSGKGKQRWALKS